MVPVGRGFHSKVVVYFMYLYCICDAGAENVLGSESNEKCFEVGKIQNDLVLDLLCMPFYVLYV